MPPKTVKSGWPLTTPNAVRIRSLDRLWPGRHRRRQRWGCGHRGADAGPVRRQRGAHRRPDPGRRHGRAGAAGGICQRERIRCRTGRSGSCHVHLRGAAAARDRARWRRETTAVRNLARGWRDSGGEVVGLAPSAAAAAQLRDATGVPADTLAKLTWSVQYGELPDWAERIGRSSLVIIDEAGMADTLSLDTAVRFVIGRGASIRLVGDDQQL